MSWHEMRNYNSGWKVGIKLGVGGIGIRSGECGKGIGQHRGRRDQKVWVCWVYFEYSYIWPVDISMNIKQGEKYCRILSSDPNFSNILTHTYIQILNPPYKYRCSHKLMNTKLHRRLYEIYLFKLIRSSYFFYHVLVDPSPTM